MALHDIFVLKTNYGEFEGTLLESTEDEFVTLKLKSGYNVLLPRKDIVNKRVLKRHEPQNEKESKEPGKRHGLKTVSILHTGGTVASKVDYKTGAVSAKFTPEDLLSMFPELQDYVNIQSRLVRNMASDDMRFAHYNLLAKEIKKEVENGADGIIITHGTDMLHYTAAALSFILEDLPVPVILVGSQRSSDRGSSDAAMNLICAVRFIAETEFAEVAVCMHSSMNDSVCWILSGTRCRKMHSSRRDAFQAVNDKPLAEIDYERKHVKFLKGHWKQRSQAELKLRLIQENLRVGIVKAHPNMYADELKVYDGYDGLILEGTGLGHFPISEIDEFTLEHKKIFLMIKKLAKKIPVVMASQTIFGRINMNVYSPGRQIQDAGLLGHLLDMSPETAFVKLAWVISNYPGKVKEMFHKNIAGEISKRGLP